MTLCSALYYGSSHSHDVICHWTPLISERSARFNWSVLGGVGGGDAAVVTAEVFSSGHTLLSFFFSFAMMQILKVKTALAGI